MQKTADSERGHLARLFLVQDTVLESLRTENSCHRVVTISLAKIGVDAAENEPLEVWRKIQFIIHLPP